MKLEVDIPVSDGFLDGEAAARLRRLLLETAVLDLFASRRLSSADATSKLGLTRLQFMELARERGISHHVYTAEHLAADVADLEKLENKLPRPASSHE